MGVVYNEMSDTKYLKDRLSLRPVKSSLQRVAVYETRSVSNETNDGERLECWFL